MQCTITEATAEPRSKRLPQLGLMLWRHMRQQRFNGAGGSGCNHAKNHEATGSRGANGLLAIRSGAQRHDENIGRLMRCSPNRSRMPILEATDPARAHECAGDFVVEAVRRLYGNDVSRAAVGRPAADGGDDLPHVRRRWASYDHDPVSFLADQLYVPVKLPLEDCFSAAPAQIDDQPRPASVRERAPSLTNAFVVANPHRIGYGTVVRTRRHCGSSGFDDLTVNRIDGELFHARADTCQRCVPTTQINGTCVALERPMNHGVYRGRAGGAFQSIDDCD